MKRLCALILSLLLILPAQPLISAAADEDITYTLAPSHTEVGIGKTLQLYLTDPDGNVVPATYESSDSCAMVDNTGLVTGISDGHTYISATVDGGRKYWAQIDVIVIPESISVSPTSITMGLWQMANFELDSDLHSGNFAATAVSSDPDIVSVLDMGVLESYGTPGSATVTITSFNGKTATLDVTVLPPPNRLSSRLGTSVDLYAGGQTKAMDVRNSNGQPAACTYTSSNTKVATVDSKGNIKGVGGTSSDYACITATAADGLTCQVEVYLYPAPTYLNLTPAAVSVPEARSFALTAQSQPGTKVFDVVYSTSSSKVAEVSTSGVIVGKGVGTCTITGRTFNGKTDTVSVTVTQSPASIALSPAHLYLGLNEKRKLAVTLKPAGNVSECYFESSDPYIVSVTDAGEVTGREIGTVTLAAWTINRKETNCTITVKQAPSKVTLTAPAKTLGVKETVQLTATLPSGSAGAVTYTSSNTKVATVSPSGKMTGVATGSVTITAKTYNGKTSKVTLQVKKAPASIKLNLKTLKMGVGETTRLTATLSSGSTGSYTFKSSNTKIATVDPKGAVNAIAPGKATITVTTYNGCKATCTVTVYKQPGSISTKSSFTLKGGRYFTLTIKFPSNTYSHLTFKSSKPSVAKVDSAGKVTGLKSGTAVITVTTFNGKTTRCVVTVK